MRSWGIIASLVSVWVTFIVWQRVFASPMIIDEPVLSLYRVSDVDARNGTLGRLAEQFEVHRHGKTFEVIVPADRLALFKELAPTALLVEADMRASLLDTLKSYETRAVDIYRYRNFNEVQELLETIEAAHPGIARIVPYGTTPQGHPLLALKLSDNVDTDEDEPEVMITAATHGDELITTEVVLDLIGQLVAAHGKDTRLSTLVDEREIYFIPVVNPDGFVKRNRYEGGRDPNRSYPYPERESVQPTPSIAALVSFFHSRKFAATIDFHAFGELVMYPWAYTYQDLPAADLTRFDSVTKQMAATNGYTYGPIAETIYIAKGSSCDYYYWKTGATALAIEVGTSKAPHPRDFPKYFKDQQESTWLFLESAKAQ